MKIISDNDKYDRIQACFVFELCKAVRANLEKDGIKGDQLKKLVGDISFTIAAILDGSQGIDKNAGVPVVLFKTQKESEECLCAETGTYFHEYVYGNVDELFEN
jgi:hypothetical protein